MKETKILSLEALRQAMTKQEATTFTTTKGGEFTFTPKFCEDMVSTVVKCKASGNKPLIEMMSNNPNAVKKLIERAKGVKPEAKK